MAGIRTHGAFRLLAMLLVASELLLLAHPAQGGGLRNDRSRGVPVEGMDVLSSETDVPWGEGDVLALAARFLAGEVERGAFEATAEGVVQLLGENPGLTAALLRFGRGVETESLAMANDALETLGVGVSLSPRAFSRLTHDLARRGVDLSPLLDAFEALFAADRGTIEGAFSREEAARLSTDLARVTRALVSPDRRELAGLIAREILLVMVLLVMTAATPSMLIIAYFACYGTPFRSTSPPGDLTGHLVAGTPPLPSVMETSGRNPFVVCPVVAISLTLWFGTLSVAFLQAWRNLMEIAEAPLGLLKFTISFLVTSGIVAKIFTEWFSDRESVGMFGAISRDEAGNLQISYLDAVSGGLRYAMGQGKRWKRETVDPLWGSHTAIATDSKGHPHIAYHDGSVLRYAHFDGKAWRLETVDPSPNTGLYTSICLDAEDHPHISYFDWTTGDLAYATFDGASWQLETVLSEGTVGLYTSIALSPQGTPRISFYDWSRGEIGVASWTPEGWTHTPIAEAGREGSSQTSLAIDADGRAFVSFFDNRTRTLSLAVEGERWDVEVVDSGEDIGRYNALALDPAGHPAVSYLDAVAEVLKFARKGEEGWQIEVVAPAGLQNTSLLLDPAGTPHIAFFDDHGNRALRYARRRREGWSVTTVDKACPGLRCWERGTEPEVQP
ncbi:MAG: hypothetical protein D6812_03665 [Deltaproteobacteria bacterium]|nr:MAG: hypothetical protein D6812_03665 [Deltaproteobacteria bacterium]